jgi:ferredoxin-NADP reductase
MQATSNPLVQAPGARRAPSGWMRARIVETRMETRTAKTLVLDVPGWDGHDAGQHVDIRLTAPDGYTAQRSYSIASAGMANQLELTIQQVSGGEVSPYLVETAEIGDEFELRGPVGGWFRWKPSDDGPVSLIGGGSGIVPLMAMIRARLQQESLTPFHLIYSARTPDHVFYANELFRATETEPHLQVTYAFTRAGLPTDTRPPGRLTAQDVAAAEDKHGPPARTFICGPNGFVEAATELLLQAGRSASTIRTERFGPSGG